MFFKRLASTIFDVLRGLKMPAEKSRGILNSKVSKRAWIVCGASFLVQFIVFGIQNSFGILFEPLMEEFQSDELRTGMVLCCVVL